MSTGFRAFLFLLVTFGAFWAYRLRSADVRQWLLGGSYGLEARELEGDMASPLDRILDADVSLAWLRGRDPVASRRHAPPSTDPGPEPTPEDGSADPAQELEDAADLAVVEELTEPGARPAPESTAPPASGDGPSGDPDTSGSGVEGSGVEGPAPGIAQTEGGAPPGIQGFHEVIHVVQPGESLWKVAEARLGGGRRYREIIDWNPELFHGSEPDVVAAGTRLKLRLPGEDPGRGAHEDPARNSLKDPADSIDRSVRDGSGQGDAPPDSIRYHKVERNENLRKIAGRLFPSDPNGWKLLYDANRDRLASPDQLREGQVLVIPAPGGEPR